MKATLNRSEVTYSFGKFLQENVSTKTRVKSEDSIKKTTTKETINAKANKWFGPLLWITAWEGTHPPRKNITLRYNK